MEPKTETMSEKRAKIEGYIGKTQHKYSQEAIDDMVENLFNAYDAQLISDFLERYFGNCASISKTYINEMRVRAYERAGIEAPKKEVPKGGDDDPIDPMRFVIQQCNPRMCGKYKPSHISSDLKSIVNVLKNDLFQMDDVMKKRYIGSYFSNRVFGSESYKNEVYERVMNELGLE